MNEIKVFSGRDGKSKKKPFKVLNDIKLAFGMVILGRLNNKIHLYSWRKTGNRGRTVCTGEWRSKEEKELSGCHFFHVHTVTDVLITLAPGLYQQNKE